MTRREAGDAEANWKERTGFERRYDLVKIRQKTSDGGKWPAAHQSAALEKLANWYDTSTPPGSGAILAIPTGGGKTFVALRFLCGNPLSDGYKVLWLAETHHLLEQAFAGLAYSVPLIKEPRRNLVTRVVSGAKQHFPVAEIRSSDDVVFATLRTISLAYTERHPRLEEFIESAEGKLFVVFDEAHHAPAPTYRRLVHDHLRQRCGCMHLLGLTATPTYSDEKKEGWLRKIFPQGIVYQVSPTSLMADGILAKPVLEEPKTEFSPEFDDREYRKWRDTNRDLPEDIITALAENRDRNEFIARTYATNCDKYGKTIMFADRWFQCDQIREFLRARDVRADVVYSHIDADPGSVEARNKRKKGENAVILDRFRDGELDVLINVRMLTEGTDVPDVESVFLTRQTTSKILMTQMVGRALRGPKFGGTEKAHIVSFIDDWKKLIVWAKYDPLSEEPVAPDKPRPAPRPPLELVSIELVRMLARQMDSGLNMSPGPFTSLLPKGWYRVEYPAIVEGTDNMEEISRLVMVFDHEFESYERFIHFVEKNYEKGKIRQFENEAILLEEVYPKLTEWYSEFFSDCRNMRLGTNHIDDLFSISRHIAQSGDAPQFFPFEERDKHDLDRFAKDVLDRKMDLRSTEEAVFQEYENPDRFWNTIYYSYMQFKSQFDACVNRILYVRRFGHAPPPVPEDTVTVEVDRTPISQETKEFIQHRDGYRYAYAAGTTISPHSRWIISCPFTLADDTATRTFRHSARSATDSRALRKSTSEFRTPA